MLSGDMTIGKLSDHTGVKVETIRYYEKVGLMPLPPRKEGGHRVYRAEHVGRLKFIRRGRELGFSLDDIHTMLGIEEQPPTCDEVYALAQRHLNDVRQKIRDLKRLEKSPSETAKQCHGGLTEECAIIQALSI